MYLWEEGDLHGLLFRHLEALLGLFYTDYWESLNEL